MARKRKRRKWPKYLALALISTVVTGGLALAIVEKVAPEQTYIPKSIVELPSKALTAVFRPLQKGVTQVTNSIKSFLESWKLRKTIEIEYNKLRAQNEELYLEAMRNEELEQEIDRLEKLLGVFDNYKEQNPVKANVIAKETGNWFQMFTVDKGFRHGVKENMAVVNEKGLIGYVSKVYDTSADVISIVDSRAGISGIIQSSRAQGVVRGTLGIEDEATCRMYYLPVDLVPRPGDKVVTSGIGLPFPKGIEIGEVRESTRYMDENKYYVVIEPNVDFKNIEEVIVLIYEAPEEDMPDADDGQVNYVPQPLDTPRPVPTLGTAIDDPNLGAVTPPPRTTRVPVAGSEDVVSTTATPTVDPDFTLAPGATPTPNPELDALMQEELENQEDG